MPDGDWESEKSPCDKEPLRWNHGCWAASGYVRREMARSEITQSFRAGRIDTHASTAHVSIHINEHRHLVSKVNALFEKGDIHCMVTGSTNLLGQVYDYIVVSFKIILLFVSVNLLRHVCAFSLFSLPTNQIQQPGQRTYTSTFDAVGTLLVSKMCFNTRGWLDMPTYANDVTCLAYIMGPF